MAQSTYKAQSTYRTKLSVYDGSSKYEKLIDIKDFPDLGGEPEMLETTTLSDRMQTYILGIQSLDALTFTANYNHADYKKVKSYANGQFFDFCITLYADDNEMGEDSGEKFYWTGQLSVYVNGGGVNEVVEMTISISPSTEIEDKEPSPHSTGTPTT